MHVCEVRVAGNDQFSHRGIGQGEEHVVLWIGAIGHDLRDFDNGDVSAKPGDEGFALLPG